jgi:hypothetical protein
VRHPANADTVAAYADAGIRAMGIAERISRFAAVRTCGRATAEAYLSFAADILYDSGPKTALLLSRLAPEYQRRLSKLLALIYLPMSRIDHDDGADAAVSLAVASGAFGEVYDHLSDLRHLSADLFTEARTIASSETPYPLTATSESSVETLVPPRAIAPQARVAPGLARTEPPRELTERERDLVNALHDHGAALGAYALGKKMRVAATEESVRQLVRGLKHIVEHTRNHGYWLKAWGGPHGPSPA